MAGCVAQPNVAGSCCQYAARSARTGTVHEGSAVAEGVGVRRWVAVGCGDGEASETTVAVAVAEAYAAA